MLDVNVSELVGETVTAIESEKERIRFATASGKRFIMYHSQSCCESVSVEEIHGDLEDLINSPILRAEEVSSTKPTPEIIRERAEAEIKDRERAKEEGREYYGPYHAESETWTFYKFATIKGEVTIRWYGTSNGYYGEGVSFERQA